jgi:hypothetical protein
MNFKQYLNSKRNIIILLMSINCFALVVNVLEIRGENEDEMCSNVVHCMFTSDNYEDKQYQENFWPFVTFTELDYKAVYCGFQSKTRFLGFFHYFDYSEFIVYSMLLVLLFYIRWEYLRKQ